MNEPINATHPIDIYFKRIDGTVQYAADGNVAFTTEQILQTAYHAVSTTGYYNEAFKELSQKPENNKTWVHFHVNIGVMRAWRAHSYYYSH